MITIILAATTITFAVGWFKWRITGLTLLHYMKTHNIPKPSAEDIKAGSAEAMRKTFGINRPSDY